MEVILAMAAEDDVALAVLTVFMAAVGFRAYRSPWQWILFNPLLWFIFGISALSALIDGSWPFLPFAFYIIGVLAASILCYILGWVFGRWLAWRNPARHQSLLGDANLTGELLIRSGTAAEVYLRRMGTKVLRIDRITFAAPRGCRVGPVTDHRTQDKNRHDGSTVFPSDPETAHVDVALFLDDPADAARVTAQIVWHVIPTGITLTKTIRANEVKS